MLNQRLLSRESAPPQPRDHSLLASLSESVIHLNEHTHALYYTDEKVDTQLSGPESYRENLQKSKMAV